jgi:hypothetical protein
MARSRPIYYKALCRTTVGGGYGTSRVAYQEAHVGTRFFDRLFVAR